MPKSPTYLITGGAGFIGSNLVERLVEDGQAVRVLDDLSSGKKENVAPFHGRIEFVRGDVRDADLVRDAMEGVDVVFHLAAIASPVRSILEPIETNAVNIGGTLNVLIAAKEAGVRRIVFASSASVYGDDPMLPKTEKMLPAPRSPYAVSKVAGEHYCQAFYRMYGLETVCLRYFNVFGPRQDPASAYAAVVPAFITSALRGVPSTIYGNGEQSRDFVFVDNVVGANVLAGEASGVGGEVYNIAGGKATTINALAKHVADVACPKEALIPTREASRPGDLLHSCADISKAEVQLGYKCEVDLVEGIRRTVVWFRTNAL